MDENGKVLGRIHWIDLLLAAASLFVVTLSIVRFWPLMPATYPARIRIEVFAADIRPRIVESVQPGQWVRDARTGTYMGKIVEKRVTPHLVLHWSGERLVSADSPITQDLYIVVERPGEVREREGVYAGRQKVRSGVSSTYHTLYAEFHGQIQAVRVHTAPKDP